MILVIEPQCWGLEHASFNAAFLDTVLLAYPKEQLVFLGEELHLTKVRKILEQYDYAEAGRITWRSIIIPERHDTGWLRFIKEWRDLGSLLKYAGENNFQHLIFTSITNTGLLVLKIKVSEKKFQFPLILIMHGRLHTIVGRWPHKPWNWPLNLRVVLRLFKSNELRYLVLGESVYRSISEAQPKLLNNFRSIDLPNFEYDLDQRNKKIKTDKLVFGYIGTGNITKGIGAFAKLARDCNFLQKNAEFLLVGYLSSWRDKASYEYIKGVTEQQLSTDEFIRRGLSLTYVVNTSNPDFYRFGGCSSFIDALFLGKPGIYLRNKYIEYYFGLMGDIGYLCDSYEEMFNTIKNIILEFPSDRYDRQVENIEKGRPVLAPISIAPKLREIMEETTD